MRPSNPVARHICTSLGALLRLVPCPSPRFVLCCLSAVFAMAVVAQRVDRDKVSADETLYELLSSNHVTSSSTTPRTFTSKDLQETYDKNLFLVKGASFQLESINNSFYVLKVNDDYQPVFDERYPMESFVNLMLNQVSGHDKKIAITQHVYGGKKSIRPISLSTVHDLLKNTMDVYCSVTSIENNIMKAIIVYHHKKLDFINMFTLEATPEQLFSPEYVIQADLYGNIPQSNIKTLFKKYKKK